MELHYILAKWIHFWGGTWQLFKFLQQYVTEEYYIQLILQGDLWRQNVII